MIRSLFTEFCGKGILWQGFGGAKLDALTVTKNDKNHN